MAGSGGTAGVALFAEESSTRPLSGDGVGGVGKFAGGPWRSGDNPAAGSAPAPNGVPGIDDAAGIDGDAGIDGFAGTDGDSGDGEIGGNDDGGNLLAACASDRPKPKSDAGAGAGSPHTPNVPVAPPPDARSLTGGVGSLLPTSPSGLNEDGCGPRFGCGADFAPKICVYSPGFASGICAAAEGAGVGSDAGWARNGAACDVSLACVGVGGDTCVGGDGWSAVVGLVTGLPPILKIRVNSPGSGLSAIVAAGGETGVGAEGDGAGATDVFTADRTTVGADELGESSAAFV